ncbi:hypothetical protein [Saccharothrix australiensis]|uniref:Uncharacterized protein n=1 Tax=Saccharothrix australiensis TaxID=2072 RepID=A0A495W1X2_9PSEU|nr:hypothetical protein [Saccharothrix australiensis]RKT55394.1 hypothetical protein C8E97_4062 [Saccharothrix australiensis]
MTAPNEPVHYLDLVDDRELALTWLRTTRSGERRLPQRVLVVADTRDLAADFAEFQHLYVDRLNVVCVVVGPTGKTDSGAELRLPAVLSQDGSAVLWVGDPRGVWWSPDSVRGLPPGVDGRAGLGELVEALTIRDVFDEVVERARKIPHATASPGLHTVSGYIDAGQVTAAVWQAVPRLTAQSGVVDVITPPGVEGRPDETGFVIEGSALDRAWRDAASQAHHADASVRRLAGWSGLLGLEDATAARESVIATGHHLDGFAEVVRATADEIALRTGAGASTSVAVPDLGLPPRLPVEPAEVAGGLRARVTDELRAGRSLTELAAGLRGGATWLAPRGAGQVARRVDEVCPAELGARLREPAAFPRWVAPPAALPAAAVGVGVAALLPGAFWWLGPVLGLAWVCAVLRTSLSRPRVPDESTAVALLPVVAHAVAVAAGVVAARAVPWPVPVEAVAPATVAAAVGLAVLLGACWRRAVGRWHADVATAEAGAAVAALRSVLEEVVDRGWRQADRLRFWSDAMRTVAGALDDAADVLRGIAAEADAPRVVVDNPLVSPVVSDDLADLTLEALTPCWAGLASRRGLETVGLGVRDRVRHLFGDYRVHLTEKGVQAAPPFGRSDGNRELLISETLRRVPEIEAVTQRTGREEMRQLCAPRDLADLKHEAKDIQVVRFAPLLAQAHLAGAGVDPLLETCWTSSTLAAGVVRLVPLRGEVVRTYWPHNRGSA